MITTTVMRRVLAKLEAESFGLYDKAIRHYHSGAEGFREAQTNAQTHKAEIGLLRQLQGDGVTLARLAQALNAETRGA